VEKIPTLFVRDDATNRKYVLNEVNPGCEWVLAGEGVPTRKFDGSCVLVRGGRPYKRREIKPGKTPPPDFEEVNLDEVTGKRIGWVPVGDGPDDKLHREAFAAMGTLPDGTYELIGPKVNGNPERVDEHVLVHHGDEVLAEVPLTFAGLRDWLLAHDYEGIVWHHPDGRRAKLKRRDFPPAWSG
jgi:hypothetical protein